MLQKELKRGAEQMMQGMQLIHATATALQGHGGGITTRGAFTKQRPSRMQERLRGPSPALCPSVRLSLPSMCGSRPAQGCCKPGAWGLQIEMP